MKVYLLECAYGEEPHTTQAVYEHERTAKQYRDYHNSQKLNEPMGWTVREMEVSTEWHSDRSNLNPLNRNVTHPSVQGGLD